jgi:hypothetical protein
MGRREVRVTPDERLSVLETLLAKVRRSAADRGLSLPTELPPKAQRGEPPTLARDVGERLAAAAAEAAAGPDSDDEPSSLVADSGRQEPSAPVNGTPAPKIKLTAFDEPPTEERTAVSVVPSHVAIAAAAAATGGLVRFEGGFHEEETSVGNPDEMEALALVDAHDAEQGREVADSSPDADGPATLPPPAPHGQLSSRPPVVVTRSERPSARPSAPLDLEDLDAEYGPDPRSAPPPAPAPTLPTPIAPGRPASAPPPAPVVAPPAYVAKPPTPVPPPAFVAPPGLVPPPSRLQPPPSAVLHTAPNPLPPPPAFVAPPVTARAPEPVAPPPPSIDREIAASEVYVDASDVDVIELDEADVLQSVPPETVIGSSREAEHDVFERPTRVSDPAGYFADEDVLDPETLPPVRRSSAPAAHEREADEIAPASQRKPRELDRPIDDALDGVAEEEAAPESGEVESKRMPTSRARSAEFADAARAEADALDDVEPATPRPPPADVTAEVRALGEVDVIERPAPPLVPVTVAVGERPHTPRTFGQLLDAALSLGEPHGG